MFYEKIDEPHCYPYLSTNQFLVLSANNTFNLTEMYLISVIISKLINHDKFSGGVGGHFSNQNQVISNQM